MMDKGAIERFAIASRVKMRNSVSLKMTELGANPDYPMKVDVVGNYVVLTDPKNGIERHLSSDEAKARDKLLQVVSTNGFDNVVESVAYTWFNRLIAIRYMEVNNYLPSHIRVLSSITPGKKEPDLVTHCLSVNFKLSTSEKDTIIKFQNENRSDELFKLMFMIQCRELNAILPELFTKTNLYENLLFDISYTNPEGVVRDLVDNIPEDDFKDAVQIIGWMYQYYNTELKDNTFALMKKNIKITKERIPSATQLFTPDWIVRYMVENSVGRIWLYGHPDNDLKSSWKYYLDEVEQESEVQQQLYLIRKEYLNKNPEDITIIDPCMGSGHILVYAFDILMQIYESYGYSKEDAAILIVEKNLYGLDIDDRAYQLAYFAVMMKVRQYNNTALTANININIYSIPETINIEYNQLLDYNTSLDNLEKTVALDDLKKLLNQFKQGKNIGSLMKIDCVNFDYMNSYLKGRTLSVYSNASTHDIIKTMVNVAFILSKKFDVVITNPPYMGSSGMNDYLLKYVKDNYPDSKIDLFGCFIERCLSLLSNNGLLSMVTQHSFMFLSSFEKLRFNLRDNCCLINMAHLGSKGFDSISGEVVQTTSFVYSTHSVPDYISTYCKLIDGKTEKEKELLFLSGDNRYKCKNTKFSVIPSSPFAYWVPDDYFELFKNKKISDYADARLGMATASNDLFLRLWYEVDIDRIGFNMKDRQQAIASKKNWFPYNKGGDYRKWYGNRDYVVNWYNDGIEIRSFKDEKTGRIRSHNYNLDYIFKPGITWTFLSSSKFSSRIFETGFLCDAVGCGLYCSEDLIPYIEAVLCSNITSYILGFLNPSISIQPGNISSLPLIMSDNYERIKTLAISNISLAKDDWDSFELSWDYAGSPLLIFNENKLSTAVQKLIEKQKERAQMMMSNEELINELLIKDYNLVGVANSTVDNADVSVVVQTPREIIVDLISYSVGCMFGRYSLKTPGLIYAGGIFNGDLYSLIVPDSDNIIPINDEEYFGDDIVTYFCNFISKVFGSEFFEENLRFISSTLNIKGQGSCRDKIRKYFLNDFYKDHLKKYQKCPIYWLFDSGKANGFKALIYIHRYTPDLIGRMRKEYLHKMQRFYDDQLNVETDQVRRTSLQKKLDEISRYDLALELYALKSLEIDLDDGVKHNYALFQNIENSKAANDKINLLYKI